ncbi:MAG TPA: M48 family metalloprotease [Actinomycetes bacterium]|nr:M48 family metalloprotease [Actinomycetes bacterium]
MSTLVLLREQIAANRRAYQLVVAVVAGGLALLGLLVTLVLGLGVSGLGAGLGLAVLVVGLAPGLGERAALRDAGAQPADPVRWPRYHNLVEGLSQAAGLPVPRLYVVDSDAANAFSVGRDPSRSALVVTRGLLTTLNRVELEGVLAHELNHIWSWGARLATLGVALGRVPGLLRLLAPPRREFDADEGGARLTRYPPGLVSALRKLASGGQPPDGPGLRHLWIMAPGDATHPPVDERIAALHEL